MKKYICTLAITVCLTLGTVAQTPVKTAATAFGTINKSKLDSLLDGAAADNQAMGSLAIAHNGSLVYQKALGYSVIAGKNQTPSSTKTRYRIGSISKMFTATLIFELIEAGKLSLETHLSDFYPQVPNADSITVGQMLNHRSGIYNFVRDSTYLETMDKPHTQAEMLAAFARQPSDFTPGSKAAYSNTNYVLLGYIVEKLTKKTYSEALAMLITHKLGLTDTYYGGKISPEKGEARSYESKGVWTAAAETDGSVTAGAGAIVSTPADLVKFIYALFNGKLVSPANLALMSTIQDGYGMGMFQIPFGPKKAFGHHGDIDGFSSVVAYFPEDKMAYAYCGNVVVYPIKSLINGVLHIYYNLAYRVPVFKKPVLSATDLDRYTGNYSSLRIPLKIAVTRQDNLLIAQISGQPSFVLTPLAKDKFSYALAGIVMDFRPVFGEITLKQNGEEFPFTRDQ